MRCVLGLDIGTTSTIGTLIRLPDQVLGIAQRPVTLQSPAPGWAEEDPYQWWSNVCAVIRDLIAASGIDAQEIAAIGVSGMLPAVVLIDESGIVLRPSIQQSDARCGGEVDELRHEWPEDRFIAKAGNGINQQLVGPKLRWIEKHEPDIFKRIGTVFGSYDYINWRLTGERAIEQNWALEAGFIDIETHSLSEELIGLAHIKRSALPRKIESHKVLGIVTQAAASETGLATGTPVVGGAADFIASALGAGLVRKGDALLKFGGSIDVLVATDRMKPDPRMYLDYHLIPGLFVPNGCMATGGTALNWFAANFAGGAQLTDGETTHQALDRLAAAKPAGAEGVAILPYFLGEKTPVHDPNVRGLIGGLTLSHDIGHLWRALLEAYAYAIRHHVEVLNDMGHSTESFTACDGGSHSRVWMQIVADVLQMPVQRLTGHSGSCLGAAWTAAVGAGLTGDWSGLSRFVSKGDLIAPNPAHAGIYADGYAKFRSLYQPH